MDRFIVWVDNIIVETTSTKKKAQNYAEAWREKDISNRNIRITKTNKMTNNDEYLFMNENIGKKCIITDNIGTINDHINYKGQILIIESVSNDGFYIFNEGYCADINEVEIIE